MPTYCNSKCQLYYFPKESFMYTNYIITSIILYIFAYAFYLITSKGPGNKAIFLQMRRYIPCPLLAILPLALIQQSVYSPIFIILLSIALLWTTTYPTLYYLSNHKVSSDFEFHFESVFGYYFLGWISSILIISHNIPILAFPVAAIVTIIEIIVLLIPISQIIYYFLYRSCINENGMLMIQETNYNEIIEFFKSMPIPLNVFNITTVVLCSYYFFLHNYHFLLTSLTINWYTNAILLVIFIFLTTYLWKKKHGVFIRTAIAELYFDIKEYRETNKSYAKDRNIRLEQLQVKEIGKGFDKPSTIVLVIGESASRDYMKAFNKDYKYNTTPWLSGVKDNHNFILFPNAYSTCAATVWALSRALTEFNQYDNGAFYKSCSIVDIAQKLGYKVHWYSNQGHLGCADTPVTLIAETSDVAKWTKQELNKVQYDETLLDYLEEVDSTRNNLVVIHLKGNHFSFLNRFPESFTKFGTPGKYDLEVNYADSIAYTDYVLQQIYEYAKDKLNLQSMIYFSDHATIPDKRRSPNFQGFGAVRIPFFTYFSDEYIEKNPEVYNALKFNKDKYWTNDLAYELICSIFNISSNRFKEENSIASKKYKFKKEDLRTNLGATSLADDK